MRASALLRAAASSSVTRRRLPPLPTPADILRLYGLRAKKSLSQNFLLDPRCLDKLAKMTALRYATIFPPK